MQRTKRLLRLDVVAGLVLVGLAFSSGTSVRADGEATPTPTPESTDGGGTGGGWPGGR